MFSSSRHSVLLHAILHGKHSRVQKPDKFNEACFNKIKSNAFEIRQSIVSHYSWYCGTGAH